MSIEKWYSTSTGEPCHGCADGRDAGFYLSWWPRTLHFHRGENPSPESCCRCILESNDKPNCLHTSAFQNHVGAPLGELHVPHMQENKEKFPTFALWFKLRSCKKGSVSIQSNLCIFPWYVLPLTTQRINERIGKRGLKCGKTVCF